MVEGHERRRATWYQYAAAPTRSPCSATDPAERPLDGPDIVFAEHTTPLAFRFVLNVHLADVLALVGLALVRPVFSEPLTAHGAEIRSVAASAAPQERPEAHRERDEAPPGQLQAARSSHPYGVAGR